MGRFRFLRSAAPTRAALAWVLAALLLAQTLGFAHGVVHGQGLATLGHRAHTGAVVPADPAHGLAHGDGWKRWLIGLAADHDEGDATCQQLDQLGHGQALPTLASLPALVPSTAVPAWPATAPPAQREAQPYQPRAPPAA